MISIAVYSIIAYMFCALIVFCYAIIAENKGCNIRQADIVNPLKWVSFVRGTLISIVVPRHKLEQIAVQRIFNDGCKACLDKGCCLNCGCSTYEKMLDSNSACSSGHWTPTMSKSKWEEWKSQFTISITIKKN